VAIKGCVDARAENQLKDYNRELGSIVRESDTQVMVPFFQTLGQRRDSPQDLQTAVSGFRVTAEQQLAQARKLDVPGDMANVQESALIALDLRVQGLRGVASRVRPALGDRGGQADQAMAGIAGQMQNFLASDVLWQGRVVPLIKQELADAQIGGQTIANTDRALRDLSWLSQGTVAQRLGQSLSGGAGSGGSGTPAPGLHGTGLVAVSAGAVTLQPGTSNRIPASTSGFTVRFANQGENDEFDVRVVVRLTPLTGGGRPITLQKTVDTVARGAEAVVTLPFSQRPAANRGYTVAVETRPVPGEKKTDNNKQEYQAIFE
jgi:hypothetical protein